MDAFAVGRSDGRSIYYDDGDIAAIAYRGAHSRAAISSAPNLRVSWLYSDLKPADLQVWVRIMPCWVLEPATPLSVQVSS